jgi:peptide/nickel transport system substrate-binding protein
LFSCDSFHPGSDTSINISGLCDKTIDGMMKHALSTGVTDPAAATKEWSAIDKAVTDQAPAIVLFTPKYIDFLSKRVGNYIFNAQYYWQQSLSWVQ